MEQSMERSVERKVGEIVEVFNGYYWLYGKVKAKRPTELRIHYLGWHSKYDEWFDSKRIEKDIKTFGCGNVKYQCDKRDKDIDSNLDWKNYSMYM